MAQMIPNTRNLSPTGTLFCSSWLQKWCPHCFVRTSGHWRVLASHQNFLPLFPFDWKAQTLRGNILKWLHSEPRPKCGKWSQSNSGSLITHNLLLIIVLFVYLQLGYLNYRSSNDHWIYTRALLSSPQHVIGLFSLSLPFYVEDQGCNLCSGVSDFFTFMLQHPLWSLSRHH